MKIELKEITIGDLTKNYKDNQENGVVAFNGLLDVRPPYQREFVYLDEKRDAVIETVLNGYPLNVMYWAVRGDGSFEVIDGQQRTISICRYVVGDFAYNFKYFHNLQSDEQQKILQYKLMVYVCSGEDSEKLKWFETINIAGEELTKQELRNAVYSGSWVTDAKKYFSKNGCVASKIGSDYLKGSSIRQEYLETAIKWISDSQNGIDKYMSIHQHDSNASALWIYFQSVISWVEATFVQKRKSMKGVEWGFLYNKYNKTVYDAQKIEIEIKNLVADDDVTKESGIYYYILDRNEKHLSIRSFTVSMKQKVFEKQKGICVKCNKIFIIEQMEADHITPWSEGGKTNEDNCQMLCQYDNRIKSNK